MKTSLFIGLIILTLFFACQETEDEKSEPSSAEQNKIEKIKNDSLVNDAEAIETPCPPMCD